MAETTNEETRAASGSIQIKGRLVCFLYLLLRDKLPGGTVEQLVMDVESTVMDEPVLYTNGWMAQYAANLAERLQK